MRLPPKRTCWQLHQRIASQPRRPIIRLPRHACYSIATSSIPPAVPLHFALLLPLPPLLPGIGIPAKILPGDGNQGFGFSVLL